MVDMIEFPLLKGMQSGRQKKKKKIVSGRNFKQLLSKSYKNS